MITRIKDEGDGGLRVTILSEAGVADERVVHDIAEAFALQAHAQRTGQFPAITTPTEEPEVKKAKGKKK